MNARVLIVLVLALIPALPVRAESIDGRVLQVGMPLEDVTVYYIESKGGMTVELRAPSAAVQGRKFYIGDGKIAIEVKVVEGSGILLQGKKELKQGDVFKKGSDLQVLPGYKKASALTSGDVYVTLPGVTFKLPAK